MSICKLAVIVRQSGKYWVLSEKKDKKLGGPYDTIMQAEERLDQIEYWKKLNRKRNGKRISGRIKKS